ncbi:hypothetical protein G7Z17_g10843 [Cylindrodendrum hubeiense]|uniref:EF-hand domain-containing protein n=1 Tax=Cylindrodendrum hubeiense TaxID=595255 RepID=A0A9P5LBY0_9HYPO|nr:hypothetical protein G7Z17_g10843 [Cylindrodendrum hubeiense]
MRPAVLLSAACAGLVAAHSQQPIVPEGADWMTKHMAEEHHIAGWDASSFFALHDYDSNGRWEAQEMQRTYGLMDVSNKDMPQARRDEVLKTLLDLLDKDGDFAVSLEEWTNFIAQGKTLPDLSTGPGHHGDDEYEYEIHHWEKYHDENTKLEDLNHPEDIEHFKKHEELEDEEDRLEALNQIPIVEANIPSKFRRSS